MTATLTKPRIKGDSFPPPATPMVPMPAPSPLEIERNKLAAKLADVSEYQPKERNKLRMRLDELTAQIDVEAMKGLPATKQPPKPKVERVPLKSIDAGDNHRQATPKVHERAKSMEAVGQLQPIAVQRKGKRFELIFGATRLAAAELLKWETIEARVYEDLTAADVEAIRGSENIQREGITFIEEALIVANVVKAVRAEMGAKDDDEPAATGDGLDAIVGARLGKSPGWVRDRMYVARLDKRIWPLVTSGRLPLGNAREIAKLGDREMQVSFAEDAARWEDGTGGESVEETRRQVNEELNNLKSVPWRLDVVFPRDGRKPRLLTNPCVVCPFNTANDRGLFERDPVGAAEELEAKAGRCTNTGCFEARQVISADKLEDAAKKAAAAKKKDKDLAITERGLGDAGIVPEVLRPATVARKAKVAIEGKPASKPRGAFVEKKRTPEEIAKSKFDDAISKWRNDARNGLNGAINTPERKVYAMLLGDLRFFHGASVWYGDKSDAKAVKTFNSAGFQRRLAKLAKPSWKDIEALVNEEKKELQPTLDLHNTIPAAIVKVAEIMGVKLKPAPKLEDFLPKAAAIAGDGKAAKAAKADTAPDDDDGGFDDFEDEE